MSLSCTDKKILSFISKNLHMSRDFEHTPFGGAYLCNVVFFLYYCEMFDVCVCVRVSVCVWIFLLIFFSTRNGE